MTRAGHRAGRCSRCNVGRTDRGRAGARCRRSSANVQRHHYAIAARVRPLLLFWIGRSGVGDAVVTQAAWAERNGLFAAHRLGPGARAAADQPLGLHR